MKSVQGSQLTQFLWILKKSVLNHYFHVTNKNNILSSSWCPFKIYYVSIALLFIIIDEFTHYSASS